MHTPAGRFAELVPAHRVCVGVDMAVAYKPVMLHRPLPAALHPQHDSEHGPVEGVEGEDGGKAHPLGSPLPHRGANQHAQALRGVFGGGCKALSSLLPMPLSDMMF